KLIRLLVDDEPFDVRYGICHDHRRCLDLRAGTLTRSVRWSSPASKVVEVHSTRLVSFTHRAVAAIRYEVKATDRPLRVVAQSELVANETLPSPGDDPRASAVLDSPLVGVESQAAGKKALLVHRTRKSGLLIGAAMDHEVEGPQATSVQSEAISDVARLTVAAELEPGESLVLVKYVAYGWSSRRSRPGVHDQVMGALAAARLTGWEGLVSEQRRFLDEYWASAEVEVDGDPEVQQAVRFGLFHILQAGARAERRPIPAKGLTGPGYDGHAFWDTETFVLPVLTYTRPEVAADVLRWRASILHHAVERAATRLDLGGAAFPWRTISGVGSSGYWPAGAAAVHVNADIAGAALQYLDATQDDSFETEVAVPLLVGTARLWASLGYYGPDGQFHIDGVTGPDEYSALADDNVYTNLGAKKNLAAAAELCARHPDHAAELGVSEAERCRWTKAAQQMAIPFDAHLGVHPQAHRFTEQQTWDFASTRTDQYPLMLHFPYLELYRKQVVKQADLVLAMQLHPDEFTDEQKAANFAYYEGITVRDSSLSASTQAVIAAEVGHLELAYDYLGEAALMDLKDLEHNTRDGLHMAALAGAWTVLVVGFGRMRPGDGRLRFSPRLPASLSRIAFRICYRDRRLQVEILPRFAIYRLTSGQPLEISHHGQIFELASEAVTLPIPDGGVSRKPPPGQPSGRAPAHRLGVKNPDLNDSGAQRESEP
ncbi:MAG: glycoside hydrolase family 65 protein, partial [Acidimicrobiaceae bacterium]|nr:glycoside hydrolase family 65 protein [Acidimicrobiaceae bacterium]